MKVFIADDSLIIRERLVTLMTAVPGIEVVGQAGTKATAKRLIQKLRPDVVILDIQMPDGSGIDLLQVLKKSDFCPLIMMITSSAFPQYRKRCLEAGADHFFDKATEIESLRATLCRIQPQFACS